MCRCEEETETQNVSEDQNAELSRVGWFGELTCFALVLNIA